MGILHFIISTSVLVALLSYLMLYFRYFDMKVFDVSEYKLPDRPAFVGNLARNDKLSDAKYILEGEIVGPESIIVEDGIIYTGLYDGRVVKIIEGKIVKEIRFRNAKDCGNYDSEPRCGRPLGMRRLNKDEIVVADAYLGIFSVNFNSGKYRQLVSAEIPVENKLMRFLNDIEVLDEDTILFSDSSSSYDRRNFMNVMFLHKEDGRILQHKLSTGETTVFADRLVFPNGIQLTADKKSLLVSELCRVRIVSIDIATKKQTIFADNLPGLPDNIRLAPNGSYWVGLAAPREKDAIAIVDLLGQSPRLRQILLDLLPGNIGLDLYGLVKSRHGMIIQLDKNGNIITSLHDPKGKRVKDASQVTISGDKLYIGSYHSPYIAVVDI